MSVSIDDLERAVFARQFERAGMLLMQLLDTMAYSRGGFVKDATGQVVSYDDEMRLMTRLAGAMIALMADPAMRLSQGGYEKLSTLNPQISNILELSGYRGAEHLWRLVSQADAQGQVQFTEDALRRALAFSSLSTLPIDLANELQRLPKAVSVPALLGLLSHTQVLTPQAEAVRHRLLEFGPLLQGHLMPDVWAGSIAYPWMHCSYADRPDKHEIKHHLNRALMDWMAFKGVRVPPPAPSGEDKPRMAVFMEYARAGHAMWRCYGAMIEHLKRDFTLISISDARNSDKAVLEVFDENIFVPYEQLDPKPYVERFVSARADVAYFPSVGMTPWAIWAANLRIAPLQFMTMGHPATSHSMEMDFVLTTDGIRFDPACFSEKVVVMSGAGTPFQLHEDSLTTPPDIRESPECLRIAVPAKLFKLSSAFLAACRDIANRAGRPVEFHFFPNETGAMYQAARQRVEEALPDVPTRTYPTTAYGTYIRNLDRCDIALGGFNFGNTNGAVDALVRCIPIVALDGPEIHQGAEQILMRPLGLPEWLVAESAEAYVAAAVRLIQDDAERVRLSRALEGRTEAFLAEERGKVHVLANAVKWMYDHRDELRASREQVIHAPVSA